MDASPGLGAHDFLTLHPLILFGILFKLRANNQATEKYVLWKGWEPQQPWWQSHAWAGGEACPLPSHWPCRKCGCQTAWEQNARAWEHHFSWVLSWGRPVLERLWLPMQSGVPPKRHNFSLALSSLWGARRQGCWPNDIIAKHRLSVKLNTTPVRNIIFNHAFFEAVLVCPSPCSQRSSVYTCV